MDKKLRLMNFLGTFSSLLLPLLSPLLTSPLSLSRASERYQAAKLLIDCVLMTASESSDRKVLQQFIQLFSDQISLCEESKSML
jgi:hypothetical protein